MNKSFLISLLVLVVSCTNTDSVARRGPLPSVSDYGLDQTVNIRASRAQSRYAKAQGIDIPVGNYLPSRKVAPRYPIGARSKQRTGWVLVVFNVTESGNMENLRVLDEYPKRVFSNSALEAAAQFEFDPYLENGVATPIPNAWNLFTYELY